MNDIFERRDGESLQAHEAARTYFALGADRSIVAVSKKLGRNKSLISGWSIKWNWVERARAWDEVRTRERDQEIQKAMADAAQRVAKDWETRETAFREKMYELYLRHIAKSDKMLEFPLARVTTETVDGPTGQVRQTVINPGRWTFDTCSRMAARSIEFARMAFGHVGAPGDGESERRMEDWPVRPYVQQDRGEPLESLPPADGEVKQ